jgi:hypothetical protein
MASKKKKGAMAPGAAQAQVAALAAATPLATPAFWSGGGVAAVRDIMREAESAVRRPPIATASGLSISIQAGPYSYCLPRSSSGPYENVEAGYPSERVEEIMEWVEDEQNPTATVYGRVPVAVLARAIAARGGRADAQADWKPEVGFRERPGPDPLPGEPPGPRRVDLSGAVDGLAAAAAEWAQQAALGSPFDEMGARFEAWSGGSKAMGWPGFLELLADPDLSGAQGNDWRPWAARALVACELAAVSAAAMAAEPSAKPRL